MASDRFQVYIKDLAGQSFTVEECTPDMPVSDLISQFRDNISPMYKRQIILLFKDDGSSVELDGTSTPLNVMGTLKSNGIEHDTKLFAIYKFWVSCINPEPIPEPNPELIPKPIVGHLHHWIENNINKFKPKFDPKKVSQLGREVDCTDFFKQYNKWDNGKHSFFLTSAQMPQFNNIDTVETNTHTNEPNLIGYKSDLSGTLAYIKYSPNQLGQLTRELMANNIFVRGNLHKVKLIINQKKGTQGRTLDRGFEIYVILKGPIEICRPNGDIQYSSNNPDAECKIPYDYIEMCSEPAEFYMSNNTQGGRRVKRLKRTPSTKRTQKKIKTRHTHKKRS